jgi:thiamine transport system substrate-binding protein
VLGLTITFLKDTVAFGGKAKNMAQSSIKLFFSFLFIFYLTSCDQKSKNQKSELIIFTYSSFQSSWGPAPKLKKEFEKSCECIISFKNAGDAEIILNRIRLNKNEPVDMVLGINQLSLFEAKDNIQCVKRHSDKYKWSNKLPKSFVSDSHFYLLDWAPLTFNTHNESIQFNSLKEIFSSKYKVSLQDPRMSAPGLQLLYWLISTYGITETMNFYKKLVKKNSQVMPSWSAAYGLYKKKLVDITFSYFTSPIYHQINENSDEYRAIMFNKDTRYPVHLE